MDDLLELIEDEAEVPGKSSSQPPMRAGSPDDFQTPPSALRPLMELAFMPGPIWEPAAGKGNLARAFVDDGRLVIASDILTGQDFLTWTPPDVWGCIVTNPPFSLKDEFLARCYAMCKPFALLMPLTALEGQKRQRLFREHGVEIILMPRRINFETPSGTGTGSWFATAWFTWGMHIGRELTFWTDEQPAQKSLEVL